jgi:glycerol kinase
LLLFVTSVGAVCLRQFLLDYSEFQTAAQPNIFAETEAARTEFEVSELDLRLRYILALDQGTSSSRALLFRHDGSISSIAQREFRQIFPQPGWVEHDPEEIGSSQIEVAVEALCQASAQASEIAGIGITNQRETTVVWSRDTGKPVHNAIVWQDRRTAEFCEQIKQQGQESLIQQRTGLLIDAYFSASKIRWILDNVPNARQLAEAGRLGFGTVDSWLLWKLTGGKLHITDASNASRTMLWNIHSGAWDKDLLQIFDIPESLLPEVRSSSEVYGEVSNAPGLNGIPIAGIAGDQQAALFGQRCCTPGLTKNTYGTGCFMLQNTGTRPVASRHRLLTTVAWKIGNCTDYALEGSIFVGGAVVQWLRDALKMIHSSAEVETLAKSVPDNGGVYFVPAFVGLGAPHWDAFARGTIFGLTRGTTAAHVARAALESIAYQVADLMDALQIDTGRPLPELRVDGGASANDTLMQFQADITGVPVIRPAITESTALGAALLAGLAVGFWKDLREISAMATAERRFHPEMSAAKAKELRERWKEAVLRSRGWLKDSAARSSQ